MKEKLYSKAPLLVQNLLISLYNLKNYKVRTRGEYYYYLNYYTKNYNLSRDELLEIQNEKFKDFVLYAYKNSKYYKDKYSFLEENMLELSNIAYLPILTKEELRENINNITIESNKLVSTKTGGTTGKALTVRNTKRDRQERFGFLDSFRGRFGYKLGMKTAWFSGKSLLTKRDVEKKRFWKTDYFYNVRYYSTFHIKNEYLHFYIEDLVKYSPEFLVGFPSTMNEIAKYGIANGIDFPLGKVKAIFPTSETITLETRKNIETFFKSKMYNQYASSEGAPFIFECRNNKLHLELQSGVFEVLDNENLPAKSGRLVVTSFTTHGTPLVRYDIGDSIELEDSEVYCNCGNNNPLVKFILGRIDDFIYSEEVGKINLGNISNTLKGTKGIIKFQVVQDYLDVLDIYIVKDDKVFNSNIEKIFVDNWKDRVGSKMKLMIHYVKDIGVEKSGKYRLVKNNIKHLL